MQEMRRSCEKVLVRNCEHINTRCFTLVASSLKHTSFPMRSLARSHLGMIATTLISRFYGEWAILRNRWLRRAHHGSVGVIVLANARLCY